MPRMPARTQDVKSGKLAANLKYRGNYNGILPQIDLTNTYREGEAGGSISPTVLSANANVSLKLIDPGEWASIQLALATYRGSGGVGILFGFWHARKASLFSPIEALRYE